MLRHEEDKEVKGKNGLALLDRLKDVLFGALIFFYFMRVFISI